MSGVGESVACTFAVASSRTSIKATQRATVKSRYDSAPRRRWLWYSVAANSSGVPASPFRS